MRRVFFVAVFLALFGSLAALGSQLRAPITILGNADFTQENGVVGGSGTDADPYIIAGWEINVPAGVASAVKIENVSARFVVRGLLVRGAVMESGAAIHLGFVTGGTIENCSIQDSMNGIEVEFSTDAVVRGNVLYVSGQGLRVTGESADEYRHAIDESNVLNNYPIRYLYGRQGETVSGITSSNLYVVSSRDMTISDNEILCGDGIQLAFVTDSRVAGNVVHRTSAAATEHGISLYECTGNTITANLVSNNRRSGINLWLSSGNHVTMNQLDANDTGISLAASDDNEISGNLVRFNPSGIVLAAGSTGNVVEKNSVYDNDGKYSKYGISVQQSAYNRIEQNGIVGVETGIELAQLGDNNTVLANTIVGASGYAVSITGSDNEIAGNLIAQKNEGVIFPETLGKARPMRNRIHDNVFAENVRHVYLGIDTEANVLYKNAFLGSASLVVLDRGANAWTDPEGGNFWENYAGGDANGDGIGDVPVTIGPAGSKDTSPILSAAFAQANLGILTGLDRVDARLRTANGKELSIPVLVADAPYSWFVGFRGFPALLFAGFPGILFSFGKDTDVSFTMETVVIPLDIAFFDSTGAYAGGAAMEAEATTRYKASVPIAYALELPSGTLKNQGIGAGAQLVLPVAR